MKNQTCKPSLQKYKNTMIPHLLPLEAKVAGVTQEDKAEWRAVCKSIKDKLIERYKIASAETLWEDLSFRRSKNTYDASKRKRSSGVNAKKQTKPIRNKVCIRKSTIDNYCLDNDIIDNIKYASESTKDWIFSRRSEHLAKKNRYEKSLANMFELEGYKVIPKMPFYIEERIFFTDLFIPALRIAIEIVPVGFDKSKIENSDRGDYMHSIGVKNIYIYNHEALNPDTVSLIISKYSK